MARVLRYIGDKIVDVLVYIAIISVIAAIPYFVLPTLSPPQVFLSIALAAIIGIITVSLLRRRVAQQKSAQAQRGLGFSHLDNDFVHKMGKVIDTFKPLVGTSEMAPKNIALDLLKSEGVSELLGKGVAGWRAFFQHYGDYASESFNHVTFNLTKFVQEPQNKTVHETLANDFKVALMNNYTCLECFYQMLGDIGANNIPVNIENRYKLFRVKYNLFINKLLDIVDDLDKQGSPLGTALLSLVEELEQRHRFALPTRFS